MKRQRHREILEIISQESVETQEDLARRLRERGFEVTQATVSRDIKELRLLKVLTDEGSYRYAVAEKAEQGLTERLRRIFTETALHVDVAENLIVIKTLPGSASNAGVAVDELAFREVAGSIAGDDTLLLICESAEDGKAVAERLLAVIKG